MADEKQLTVRDENSLAVLIERPEYRNRFRDVLGARAPQFVSSVLSLQMHMMRDVEPKSMIAAAMTAASLDLPINPNLGFAYIIAYADKNRGGVKFAQFQIGYKGFVQLAMRTGKYRFMNTCEVFDGELIKYDKLTGELSIDQDKKASDKVVGYASYFKLVNGFEHALYMTVEQVTKHGKQYSQSFKKGYGLWVDNFSAMALKTVLKLNLSKWGVLTVEMERAIYEDQGVKFEIDSEPNYVDNTEPIAPAQIEGRKEEPEPSAAAQESPTPPAPALKAAKKKVAAVTKLRPDAPTATDPVASEPLPPGGPHAGKLVDALNVAGYLLSHFIALAIYEKWLPAPQGYDGDIGSIDLTTFIIPEEKANEFVDPDNLAFIIEQLGKAAAA